MFLAFWEKWDGWRYMIIRKSCFKAQSFRKRKSCCKMKMLQVQTRGFHSNTIWWLNGLRLLGRTTHRGHMWLVVLQNLPQAVGTRSWSCAPSSHNRGWVVFNATRWNEFLLIRVYPQFLSEINVMCGEKHSPLSYCQIMRDADSMIKKGLDYSFHIYEAVNDFQSSFTSITTLISTLPVLQEVSCRRREMKR